MKLLVRLVIVVFIVVQTNANGSSSKTKSCKSTCFDNKFPPCGAWLAADNSQQSSGAYVLGEGSLNLTCVVNSLPTPTVVNWLYRVDFDTEWRTLRCSSLKIVTDCHHNSIGEHQVSSMCLVKTDTLALSGAYRCSAVDVDSLQSELATSAETLVQVVGIANVSIDTGAESDLHFGHMGRVRVIVCANPKPDVVWTIGTDLLLQSGQSHDRFSALPLHPVSDRDVNDRLGPSHSRHYCYAAQLLISDVHADDGDRLAVTVANYANTVASPIHLNVQNVPQLANDTRASISLLLILNLVMMWWCQ